MSKQLYVEGCGTVELSDEEAEKLSRGETVSVNFCKAANVSNETHELYFGKGHDEAMKNYSRNPECVQGKHDNCRGDTWDDVNDCPAVCECACHYGLEAS